MKKVQIVLSVLIASLCISACCLRRGDSVARPVTPNAAPEAVELLKFIYRISGRHTLSGQHNYAGDKDSETLEAARAWGKTPAIFGKDWGFAKEGNKDSAFVRDDIVSELEKQYQNGSLVVMCWHEVPPTADEPVAFRGRRGAGPTTNLNTVQGHLTEAQYKDLLTPGTALHQHWCDQVDAIVPYLKKLQDAHVPVLWRPFHEMNGAWFWWGGRRGEYGTAALYKMMFDRLVKHHKIKNLIWVWNVDRPEGTSLQFEDCWPGPEYVDVLSLDCYQTFKQSYYDDLLKLANGKPIALAEVGGNLSLDVLKAQPRWAWWMVWAGMGVQGSATNRLAAIVNDPLSWSLDDPDYRKALAPIRAASGLPAEPPPPARP
jgi:mannan endo-1,4-beta-mannosidase